MSRFRWMNHLNEWGGLMADEYVDYSDLEAVRLQKAILSYNQAAAGF